MTWVTIFFAQVAFNILKVLEIRYTYEQDVPRLLFNSVWMGLVSLASTFWSVDELLKGNWYVVPVFILGNVIGKYIGMKIEHVPMPFFLEE